MEDPGVVRDEGGDGVAGEVGLRTAEVEGEELGVTGDAVLRVEESYLVSRGLLLEEEDEAGVTVEG